MSENIDYQSARKYTGLEFLAKQIVEGFITGLHKSPFHGFSVEFAEHRLYNKGESTRHIDWKLFARTEKLFVKRYEEETNLRCQIVIDTSSSMNFPFKDSLLESPNKLAFSIQSAAAFIYMLKKQRDAFGLTLFSDSIEFHSQAKSNITHQQLLFSKLEEVINSETLGKKTATVELLHQIADSIHKRSLVIVFSDMVDSTENIESLFSALQHLRHNKHEVILFHVHDKKKELNFDYENRPYTFVDVESGEEIKVNPVQVRESYLKQSVSFEKELRLKCAQFKIEFVDADINEGYTKVLEAFMAKRAKLI